MSKRPTTRTTPPRKQAKGDQELRTKAKNTAAKPRAKPKAAAAKPRAKSKAAAAKPRAKRGRKPRVSLVHGIVRALLPLNILELLAQKPQHGLQIAGRVEGASGGAWSPSPGTLYPMLQRMEDDGLIKSELQRSSAAPRRVYQLTAKGRRARTSLRRQLTEELQHAKALVDQHLAVLVGGEPLMPHSEEEMKQALAHGKLR